MFKTNLLRNGISILITILLLCSCDKKEDGKITVVTKPVTDVTVSSAKSGGNVTVTGNFSIGMCGVCWSKSPSPSTNDYFTTDNTGAGEFVSNIKNLEPDTKYFVRAYATTSSGIMYGEEIDFTTESLSVASVTVNTSEVSEITASTAKCGGVVTASGDVMVTARGVYWSTFQNFSQNVSQTSDGQGLGSFTSNLSELSASTMYYVKAYATTADGNIVFGDTKTFTTGGETPVLGLPTVTIGDVTGITSTSANCSGEVTSDGGSTVTERGFCWNISPNPMVYHSHVSSGSGTGSFSAELTGLTEGATYYVRAYATNSDGTGYSEESVVFTTLSLPVVTTLEATNVSLTSATVGGTVTNDGGTNVVVRGICWNTTGNPTTNDNPMFSGSGLGNYTIMMNELMPNTTYYVRAFATNAVGTAYGNSIMFNTNASTWLQYDNNVSASGWGYSNGGTLEWAVSFPSFVLAPYIGCHMTKAKVYIEESGDYILTLYKGNSTPSTIVLELQYALTNSGWHTLGSFDLYYDPIIIDDKTIWVSITKEHAQGEYPAICSTGINEPNSRWIKWGSQGWCDAYLSGWCDRDITWMIRAYVTNESKQDDNFLIELPTSQSEHGKNVDQSKYNDQVGSFRSVMPNKKK